MAGILGSMGLAIVTPVLVVDLKDPVVSTWTIVIKCCSAVTALMFYQADPCGRKRQPRGGTSDTLRVSKRKKMKGVRMNEELEK